MSIPVTIDPMGTLGGVRFVDEYIVLSQRIRVNVAAFLQDSLDFDVMADMQIGDIHAWGFVFCLGGNQKSGWFGIEHWSGVASDNLFKFSNNTGTEHSVVLQRDTPYTLRLDRSGLSVNGTLYGAIATMAKNKADGVRVEIASGMRCKTFTFSVRGKKMFDLHAAEISGKRCLYDTVNKTIIEIE